MTDAWYARARQGLLSQGLRHALQQASALLASKMFCASYSVQVLAKTTIAFCSKANQGRLQADASLTAFVCSAVRGLHGHCGRGLQRGHHSHALQGAPCHEDDLQLHIYTHGQDTSADGDIRGGRVRRLQQQQAAVPQAGKPRSAELACSVLLGLHAKPTETSNLLQSGLCSSQSVQSLLQHAYELAAAVQWARDAAAAALDAQNIKSA